MASLGWAYVGLGQHQVGQDQPNWVGMLVLASVILVYASLELA
jgi:hypothetical protein